jgi:uncharacterized membrane protein YbhN (UPF0104 family)
MSHSSPLFSRLSRVAPVVLAVLLFGLSIGAIVQELQKYRLRDVFESLAAIPNHYIFWAIGLTVLNYVMLTGYDTLAARYVRHPLPYRKTALVAGISYAISNTVGFALLSGSAIRYRFYSTWGLSASKIAQIIAFCNLSFWLGLFTVGGVLFLVTPLRVPDWLDLPFGSVHSIGAFFLITVVAYLGWNTVNSEPLKIGKWSLPHLPIHMSLTQIAITSLDWALAAAVLYSLLSSFAALSYPGFFGIYLLAQMAGIISSVPGGLGVFETLLLFSLSSSINSATLFGVLLAYRGIYYFLPLGIGVLALGLYEVYQRLTKPQEELE